MRYCSSVFSPAVHGGQLSLSLCPIVGQFSLSSKKKPFLRTDTPTGCVCNPLWFVASPGKHKDGGVGGVRKEGPVRCRSSHGHCDHKDRATLTALPSMTVICMWTRRGSVRRTDFRFLDIVNEPQRNALVLTCRSASVASLSAFGFKAKLWLPTMFPSTQSASLVHCIQPRIKRAVSRADPLPHPSVHTFSHSTLLWRVGLFLFTCALFLLRLCLF